MTAPPSGPRRPDPEPIQVDMIRTVAVGTILWAVAGLVLLAVRAWIAPVGHPWWLWTCAAGTGLGVLGLIYLRVRDEIAGLPTRRR